MTNSKSEWLNPKGLILGAAALALLPFDHDGRAPFPGMPGAALAQTSSGTPNKRLLEPEIHVHPANFLELEKQQIKRYTESPDPEVIFKGEKIGSFYGITRAEVEALPGKHPNPDLYTQFQFKNKETGVMQSCCSGADCRPAIIKMLGDKMIAVGVHYEVGNQSVVLFFKLHVDDTNIVSTDNLLPGNPEYAKHKYHACVYQGRVYCTGVPADG